MLPRCANNKRFHTEPLRKGFWGSTPLKWIRFCYWSLRMRLKSMETHKYNPSNSFLVTPWLSLVERPAKLVSGIQCTSVKRSPDYLQRW